MIPAPQGYLIIFLDISFVSVCFTDLHYADTSQCLFVFFNFQKIHEESVL